METTLKVRSRRRKRWRAVVYDQPEKSRLTPLQFAIALLLLIITLSLTYRLLVH